MEWHLNHWKVDALPVGSEGPSSNQKRQCKAVILLMEDILHQLIGSLSYSLFTGFLRSIPGGEGSLPSTVSK